MHDLKRQEKLFETSKLATARVGIIGSGAISNFLCAYLSGLGIGEIILVDNRIARCNREPQEFMSALSHRMDPIIENIATTMRKMNPCASVMPFVSTPNRNYIASCDAVIDTTNDPDSKFLTYKHCESGKALYISCSSTKMCASVSARDFRSNSGAYLDDITLDEYNGYEQGTFTSGLVAALAADKIRKRVCPVEQDRPLEKRIDYSAIAPGRFFKEGIPQQYFCAPNIAMQVSEECKRKKALVIGAGGIGNYVLLSLAMLGVDITVYDHDHVETHNLNRQVLLFQGEGANKADVISRRIKKINPKANIAPKAEKATIENLMSSLPKGVRYDAMYSCVDSWQTRNMLNTYAARTGTPMFNAGVDTFLCVVDYFLPGKTHCLACSNDYRARVKEEKSRQGCNSLEVNVVMPNAIAGALMVAESLQALIPSAFSDETPSRIVYNSNGPYKFSSSTPVLDCERERYYKHNCICHQNLGVRR